MLTLPEAYCQALQNRGHTPSWRACDVLLRHCGRGRTQARERYAQCVLDGIDHSSIWGALQQQMYLGDARFVTQMQLRRTADAALEEVPKVQQRRPHSSLHAITREHADRGSAMAAAYVSGAYTLKAIAAYFGVHYSTVSRAVIMAETARDASAITYCIPQREPAALSLRVRVDIRWCPVSADPDDDMVIE